MNVVTSIATHASKVQIADDPPIAIAKEAIRRLENNIRQEFGIRILMGAEQEFATYSPEPINAADYVHGDDDIKKAIECGKPSSIRNHDKDVAFPDSPHVTYCYEEIKPDEPNFRKWEIVLTHLPRDKDDQLRDYSCLEVARKIEALRLQILDPKSGYKNSAKGSDAQKKWTDFLNNHDNYIFFDGSPSQTKSLTCGLHINTSFVKKDNDVALSESEYDNLSRYYQNSLRSIYANSLYLLGTTDENMQRWERRQKKSYTHTIWTPGLYSDKDSLYTENKLPHADSNPYYVVMLELAGIYHGLQCMYGHVDSPNSDWDATYPANKGNDTPELLKQHFEDSTLLKEILDDLPNSHGDRDALGARFYAAIEQCPPGKEQSASEKRRSNCLGMN